MAGRDKTTITLSLSADDKAKIKIYAYKHNTTVSDLVSKWINENCKEADEI